MSDADRMRHKISIYLPIHGFHVTSHSSRGAIIRTELQDAVYLLCMGCDNSKSQIHKLPFTMSQKP